MLNFYFQFNRIMYQHCKNAYSPDIKRHLSTQPKQIHTNEIHSTAIAHISLIYQLIQISIRWTLVIVDDSGDTTIIRRYVYSFNSLFFLFITFNFIRLFFFWCIVLCIPLFLFKRNKKKLR